MGLSREDKLLLLKIARDTIESYMRTKKIPAFDVNSPLLMEKRGAFVTIKKKGELRGCIGIFTSDKPLYLTVADMAVSASAQDPRFIPIVASELSQISIEISCLTPLKKIKDVSEIEVGRHGLYIMKGLYRGVLLPQVQLNTDGTGMPFWNIHVLRLALILPAGRKALIYIPLRQRCLVRKM